MWWLSGQKCSPLSLRTWVQFLGPTWLKEWTDFHTCPLTHTHTGTHTTIIIINKIWQNIKEDNQESRLHSRKQETIAANILKWNYTCLRIVYAIKAPRNHEGRTKTIFRGLRILPFCRQQIREERIQEKTSHTDSERRSSRQKQRPYTSGLISPHPTKRTNGDGSKVRRKTEPLSFWIISVSRL